jgi:hypothetical protein
MHFVCTTLVQRGRYGNCQEGGCEESAGKESRSQEGTGEESASQEGGCEEGAGKESRSQESSASEESCKVTSRWQGSFSAKALTTVRAFSVHKGYTAFLR